MHAPPGWRRKKETEMRLLYLLTEPLGIGGVQSDMLALSEDLTKKGHEIHIATRPGVLLDEILANGARFHDLNFHFQIWNPFGFLRACFGLRRVIRRERLEIVAPQSVRSSIIAWFALRLLPFSYRVAATGKRIPIVTTIHNIHNPVHFRYAGKILDRCCDYVIFESHYERNRVTAGGLPEDKSEVIHSGIDTDRFRLLDPSAELAASYGLDKDKHRIYGIVARLSEEKGHDYLLRAFRKVSEKDPDARLMIVGDGPLMEPTRALCTELGLDEVVVFTGMQRNVAEHLALFDVFVLSSTRESFPLAAREAMAAGRAAIVPRIGGCPEVVDEGNTGYLFESRNVDELAGQMMKIMEQDRYVEFGKRSRQRVVDLFSRRQWMDGDERVYLAHTRHPN